MKQAYGGRCPGCGKHCPMEKVRCKYGRDYFAKQSAGREGGAHKWEKYVEQDGIVWRLLTDARKVKHALRDRRITEEQLSRLISDDEKRVLESVLDKMEEVL